MAGKNVVLAADITNEDGSKFASFKIEYADVPLSGVVAIERLVANGLILPLVDLAEQNAAAKV